MFLSMALNQVVLCSLFPVQQQQTDVPQKCYVSFTALKVYSCTTGNKRKIQQTRERTAFSVVCHVPANIQATSAVECDLWYGVRRPYIALVFRCYTDFEIVKKL